MNFYKYANIFLASFVGFLIGLPLITEYPFAPLITLVLGALMGWKKGNNRFFFYLCLVSASILIAVVTKNMVIPNG